MKSREYRALSCRFAHEGAARYVNVGDLWRIDMERLLEVQMLLT